MHKAIATPLKRVARWLSGQIIQDVPDDLALCEFDCRKLECSYGKWESCPRRLRAVERMKAAQR